MSSIALCLRTMLGDGNYSMLRERKIARHGYEESPTYSAIRQHRVIFFSACLNTAISAIMP
ncbi:hypothetical protein BHAP_2141 [Bifidobacterium hapali]|uniref:Uncharacterized protein n=1 Tax=Bifidobacterium hapali TaxID=1630172 RepID=A0A261FSE5_9BIFI|nr:hypothetical protein [Bifidobacterium hapali]OZG62120.1 hypothetical protein BHAP_2141 [Bifidobacterium hapali]